MARMSYYEQLKHPNWQRKRLEVLQSADFKCEHCGSKETTLHVHHRQYINGRMAWEYDRYELLVLCENCHEEEHAIDGQLKRLLALTDARSALALLAGFYQFSGIQDPEFFADAEQIDETHFAVGVLANLSMHVGPDVWIEIARNIETAAHPTSGATEKLGHYSNLLRATWGIPSA